MSKKFQVAVFLLTVSTLAGILIIFGGMNDCGICSNSQISWAKQVTVYNGMLWVASLTLTLLWRNE